MPVLIAPDLVTESAREEDCSARLIRARDRAIDARRASGDVSEPVWVIEGPSLGRDEEGLLLGDPMLAHGPRIALRCEALVVEHEAPASRPMGC